MFKRERQFNIITGSVSPQPLLLSASQYKKNISNFTDKPSINFSSTRLGVPKDKKQFQYAYTESSQQKAYPLTERRGKQSLQNSANSLLNYVSTNYNIINHMGQIQTSRIVMKSTFQQKLPEINKKSPLTEHIHKGRLMAPNFHQDYHERTGKLEFFKKEGLCSNTCDIQKSYAQGKYFRRLK